MTLRNQIVGAALSVAIAPPLMAATATSPLPDGAERAQSPAQNVKSHHRQHRKTQPADRAEHERREARAERHHDERRERHDD